VSVYLKDRPKHHRFLMIVSWENDPPQCWRVDLRHDDGALIATEAADQPRDAIIACLDKARASKRPEPSLATVLVPATVVPAPSPRKLRAPVETLKRE
jgi:hypothetical protein